MGKQSVTVRGKAWERKNSLWIIWSFFACAGVGFLMTGKKIKEKKWIIIGIAYLVALWVGFGILGSLGEGTAAEAVGIILDIIYIGSIVHCFIVKNQYLKKLDLVMNEQEISLEEERIQREKEKLEMQKKLNEVRLQNEKEMHDSEEKVEEKAEQSFSERQSNEGLESNIYKPKNKKWLVIWGVVVVAIIAIICMNSEDEPEYFNSVVITDSSFSGATFDMTLEEAKAIIGRELQMGDMNSSTGGWQYISEKEGVKYYWIADTTQIWGAQLGVESSTGNVVYVGLFTQFDVLTNNSNMKSFCTAFSECLNGEMSVEALKDIYTRVGEQDGVENDEYGGVIFHIGDYGDGYTKLAITAASQDYIDDLKQQ